MPTALCSITNRRKAPRSGRFFQRFGATYDPNHLASYQSVNNALWLAVEKGEITPAVVKVLRFELFLKNIGVAYPPDAFSAKYLECLAECSELIEGAAEVVQGLQGKYRMAILTNGLQVVQRGRLARSAIRQHIDEVVISEEIGFAKPAKEFFDTALARLGNPSRQDALMIGDGWATDILGAARYGLDVCWYNPARKPRPSDCALTREIASLSELTEWLG